VPETSDDHIAEAAGASLSLAKSLPSTRAEMVVSELRRMIQSGELPAGTHLRQANVAKQFGLSTTPVREAFTALAREGLVTQDAHRGVVVFEPQFSDLTENYEIRGVLEPLATKLAAEALTDEELADLDQLVAKMRAEKDLQIYTDLNRQFHSRIYAAAKRPRLLAMIESLRDAADAYIRLNATRPRIATYHRQVHREHEAIAKALSKHDGARAAQLMSEHLLHNRRQLEKLTSPGRSGRMTEDTK
jgi:DNA-binding GntR family transcriptional regulator